MEPSTVARGLLATKEKRLTLSVPADVHRNLKRLAAEQDTTIKDLILESYQKYLEPKYGSGSAK